MRKPNLNRIIEDNSDKTGHIRNQGEGSLPSNSWLSQYKMGGGYFPEYHSYAPPRMEHGGASWLSQYEKGGGKKKKKASATDDYVDLQKTYGLDPFSKEGIEKARQLSKTNPRTRIVCTASGCSEIAVNAADAYGYDFERGNAWDLGNQNQVVATNPAYAGMVGQGVLPDPTNYKSPSTMFQTGSLIGLNRKNKRVGTVAKTRAEADDSYDYANQDIYPKSRGYEHVGYMIDPNTMLHGTAAVAGKHPAYYVIDNDMTNGAQLGEYGNYQPVETITPEPGIMSKIGNFFGFEDGGTNWLSKYAEGGEGGPGWGDVAWTAAQIADPTGILSYGDAYRGWRDMVQNPSWSNFGSALLNTAAALPVVGQEARAVKAGVKAGKVAKEWKELNALQKTGRVLNRAVVNPVRTLDRGIGHGAAVEATTAKLMTNAPKVVKNYVAPITTAVNRGVRWDKLMSPVGDAAIDGISNGLNYAQGRVQGRKYGGQTNWLNNYK